MILSNFQKQQEEEKRKYIEEHGEEAYEAKVKEWQEKQKKVKQKQGGG